MTPIIRTLLLTLTLGITQPSAMEHDPSTPWEKLDRELKIMILDHLSLEGLATTALVSKEMYGLTQDEFMWQRRCRQDFPEDVSEPLAEQSWKAYYYLLLRITNRLKGIINEQLSPQLFPRFSVDSLFAEDIVEPSFSVDSLFAEDIVEPKEILLSFFITNLNLSGQNLSIIPEGIFGKLRYGFHALDLSKNALTTLPKDIKTLTSLRELNISNNPIQSFPDEFYEFLKSFTKIGLWISSEERDPSARHITSFFGQHLIIYLDSNQRDKVEGNLQARNISYTDNFVVGFLL